MTTVSGLVGDDYKKWQCGDIIKIAAPTGSGKTTFVLETLLKWAIIKKMPILYMVNREILRCAVEIEALSKELYCQLGGNMDPVNEDGIPRDLYFDTDCLKLLEEKWRISKKEITVIKQYGKLSRASRSSFFG